MNDGDFRKALDAANRELADLTQKRTAIDQRMTQLMATVETLTALLQEPPSYTPKAEWEAAAEVLSEAGISEAIRHVLLTSKTPMAPPQIRDALAAAGVELQHYANPMSVIHNTLKRLEKQGELLTVKSPSGQTVAYTTRWVAESLDPVPEPPPGFGKK